jgi:undecaprenyl-diphosphatase
MAAGLAAALSWKYPRAAWFFAALAIAAATQRVATSAHYPSDVLLGAALGLAGAAVFLGVSPDRPRPAA